MEEIYKLRRNSIEKLGTLLFLSFMSVGLSQTALERKTIKANSNLIELSKLEKKVAKTTPTVSELRKQAEEIGLKFSGEYKGTLFQFAGFYADGSPRFLQTYNSGAAVTTSTNKLYKESGVFNLTGKGMTVGEWDGGGVLSSHVELAGRVEQRDSPPATNGHSTHVAGTLIAAGIYPEARGMAYEANLVAYDWNSDAQEAIREAANGLLLSNHSYGFSAGFTPGDSGWTWIGDKDEIIDKNFGKYVGVDAVWDDITYNAPYYLPVKAAGNSKGNGPEKGQPYYYIQRDSLSNNIKLVLTTKYRPKNGGEEGFDCIPGGTVGKNILAIGAVHKIPGGYKNPSDVKLAEFSSTGPTDDGRIKPDIVGAGVALLSTTNDTNESYGSSSGTSMASPNVTGSLLLLQQHYKNLNKNKFMKAATLKALLVNSANEAGENPGPYYKFGHGLLNVYEGAKEISTDKKYSLIEEKTLKEGQSNVIRIIAAGEVPVKVTIAWQDPAPDTLPDPEVLNDSKKMLVNDLDIVVMKDGEKYYPWKLDPKNPAKPAFKGINDLDNIEKVEIENPEAGAEYKIIVTHKGKTLKNGFQDYSVVASGLALKPVNDISINNLEIKAGRGEYSKETPIEVTYANLSKNTVKNAKIKYYLTNQDTGKLEHQGELLIENLEPKEIRKETFTLDLSHSFINYEIKTELDYDKDEVLVNNVRQIQAYGILTDLTAENSRFNYGFEESLELKGWKSENKSTDGGTPWGVYRLEDSRTGNYVLGKATRYKVPDAWVYTNPLKLKGGQSYRVIYYAKNRSSFNDKLRVAYGKEQNADTMTPIGEEFSIETGDYKRYYVEFTPAEDGIYYVGLHNYTHNNEQSYAVIIDDFTIMNTNGVPYVDFSAMYRDPSTYDKDVLKNESLSEFPITSYKWEITPDTFDFVDNTTRNSENPVVSFKEEDVYSIKLKVENKKGEAEINKQDYIIVRNIPIEPKFTASTTLIEDNNTVQFFDTSTGRPVPNKWKWEISPSKDVYFVNNTTDESQSPVVLFGRGGKYTVTLKISSVLGQESITKEDYITVKGKHFPVNNLDYTQQVNRINLKWDRPTLRPYYFEGFEDGGRMPLNQVTLIDEDGDGNNWFIESIQNDVSSGKYSAKSLSKFRQNDNTQATRDIKDWIITKKIRAGAEELSFDVKSYFQERFKVYVIPANKMPTINLQAIKNYGNVIYNFTGGESFKEFKRLSFDLSQFKNQDIYVAILHNTRKTDQGSSLIIDNLQVGFKNVEKQTVFGPSVSNAKYVEENKSILSLYPEESQSELAEPTENLNKIAEADNIEASSDSPKLVGYEIQRNDKVIKVIEDINNTKYSDVLEESNTYNYDVYALYSDDKKSIKQRVKVDADFIIPVIQEGLSKEGIAVYPNPTDGIFNVKFSDSSSEGKLTLYDMNGRLIYTKENVIEQEKQNFKFLTPGIYIINIEDGKGKKASFKLIKK